MDKKDCVPRLKPEDEYIHRKPHIGTEQDTHAKLLFVISTLQEYTAFSGIFTSTRAARQVLLGVESINYCFGFFYEPLVIITLVSSRSLLCRRSL